MDYALQVKRHEGHDHATMDTTSSVNASTAVPATDHSAHAGHSMPAMSGPSCKMTMYWNWYTIDACFLSKSWHITSAAMFAGSCIGVVFLVVLVEALRRGARELDRHIVRDWHARAAAAAATTSPPIHIVNPTSTNQTATPRDSASEKSKLAAGKIPPVASSGTRGFLSRFRPYPVTTTTIAATAPRPTFLQQLLKSFIYAVLLGVGYILMLLAMYYNGYIFFSLVLGAWLGNFLFGWDTCVLDESVAAAERSCGC
ncbi:hypothetical protein Dda_7284 [Drechslerella dactyloides]|uniref:Copper transport protein n=1 Tax=Drechslerella dactyloides TaxID=74499 RepID=A0AAD6NGL4_DREDA|nr:hypothetical protein Dda_7284 [Drechslerella dactyloides]